MHARWRIILVLPTLLVAGCAAAMPASRGSETSTGSAVEEGVEQFATAMTRNLCVGMDFTEVLSAARVSPLALAQQVYRSHRLLVQSVPAERMARIAAEIATLGPDVLKAPGGFPDIIPRGAGVRLSATPARRARCARIALRGRRDPRSARHHRTRVVADR
jgi:hypothetical protein